MPKTSTVIDNAVAEYTQRQTRQAVKRLTAQAERLNGDRLCRLPKADERLVKTLRDLSAIDKEGAKHLAKSMGVKF